MPLSYVLRSAAERSTGLYRELMHTLPEAALTQKLPGLASNTIGAQIWCVVGARETYTRGIVEGKAARFSCSLTAEQVVVHSEVDAALDRSAAALEGALEGIESFTDVQHRLMIDLLEHEAQHHGQLIRYLYGLKLEIPEGWKKRYMLS